MSSRARRETSRPSGKTLSVPHPGAAWKRETAAPGKTEAAVAVESVAVYEAGWSLSLSLRNSTIFR